MDSAAEKKRDVTNSLIFWRGDSRGPSILIAVGPHLHGNAKLPPREITAAPPPKRIRVPGSIIPRRPPRSSRSSRHDSRAADWGRRSLPANTPSGPSHRGLDTSRWNPHGQAPPQEEASREARSGSKTSNTMTPSGSKSSGSTKAPRFQVVPSRQRHRYAISPSHPIISEGATAALVASGAVADRKVAASRATALCTPLPSSCHHQAPRRDLKELGPALKAEGIFIRKLVAIQVIFGSLKGEGANTISLDTTTFFELFQAKCARNCWEMQDAMGPLSAIGSAFWDVLEPILKVCF
ncbi:hypothetical protein N7501_004525 [Penicillium viridicatum]|nr:hypothetical protein N7501_004525 [Penicillium viridicatum]